MRSEAPGSASRATRKLDGLPPARSGFSLLGARRRGGGVCRLVNRRAGATRPTEGIRQLDRRRLLGGDGLQPGARAGVARARPTCAPDRGATAGSIRARALPRGLAGLRLCLESRLAGRVSLDPGRRRRASPRRIASAGSTTCGDTGSGRHALDSRGRRRDRARAGLGRTSDRAAELARRLLRSGPTCGAGARRSAPRAPERALRYRRWWDCSSSPSCCSSTSGASRR